jgi:predicted Zn finger-like uncharacterized protein
MTSSVSRCPNCDTSFKVTDVQLAAAAGAVRCGACLQIFVASEYFVDAPVDDSFQEREEKEQISEAAMGGPIEAENVAIEEPAVDHLEHEVEVRDSIGDTNQNTGEEAYSVPPEKFEQVPAVVFEPAPSEADISDAEISAGLKGIAGAAPEDLVGEFVPTRNRQSGRWLAGSIVLSLVLGVQYFWFNRDILALDTRFRSYYLSVCNVANCELPDFLDAETLSTTDLIIRSHPSINNGLIVNAILRNEAPYRQRFPSLKLRFADLNGNTLAQRTFPPDLYLAGELTGMHYIPAVTEVRLSLDIVDPGPNAVSYSMLTVLN